MYAVSLELIEVNSLFRAAFQIADETASVTFVLECVLFSQQHDDDDDDAANKKKKKHATCSGMVWCPYSS